MADRPPGGGRHGGRPAQVGEGGRLALETLGVVPGRDEQRRRRVRPHSVERRQLRRLFLDQPPDLRVELGDLLGQVPVTASHGAHGEPGRRGGIARPRPASEARRLRGGEVLRRKPAQAFPQPTWGGGQQSVELVGRLRPRFHRAERRATRRARSDSAAPSAPLGSPEAVPATTARAAAASASPTTSCLPWRRAGAGGSCGSLPPR